MCVRCFIHILFVKNKKEEDKVLTYHTLVGQDCFVSRQGFYSLNDCVTYFNFVGTEFQCTHCYKYYPNLRLLKEHLRGHVNYYKCCYCDMTCTTKNSYSAHIRYRHLDSKPFKCVVCSYRWVLQPSCWMWTITYSLWGRKLTLATASGTHQITIRYSGSPILVIRYLIDELEKAWKSLGPPWFQFVPSRR